MSRLEAALLSVSLVCAALAVVCYAADAFPRRPPESLRRAWQRERLRRRFPGVYARLHGDAARRDERP